MSRFSYEASKHLAAADHSFDVLIMTAMRKADDVNKAKLEAAWPEYFDELRQRYNAPGGMLPGDKGYEEYVAWRESVTANNPDLLGMVVDELRADPGILDDGPGEAAKA